MLEIPFSIWQNGEGCETINNLNLNTSDELFKSLCMSLHDWFMTDDVYNDIEAYHYQAMTELGYYCYPISGLKDLLIDPNEFFTSIFPPENTT